MNPVRDLRAKAGLTQARLAALAGTSQPAIAAYEAGSKSPTLQTLTRLAQAAGLELDVRFVAPLTREDRRSLALHRAIADHLLDNPESVMSRARRTLDLMRRRHPAAGRILQLWHELLELPPSDLADVLVDASPWARELRHATPFAGVLSAPDRVAVYRSFAERERHQTT